MKIAVIGANGKAGRLIVKEAIAKELEVTAVVRSENKTNTPNKLVKDLFALTPEDIADFDVIVDAFAAWTPETLEQHSTSLRHLCDIVSKSEKRLIIVGGAGSLYVNPEHTIQLLDTSEFPKAFKPLASSMANALGELRLRDDVKWTYISPAADFQSEGARTGKYILSGEEFTLNSKGESTISYADYACALIDEIISRKNIQKRISVISE